MENENIVRTIIRCGQQPTDAQIKEIETAASLPYVADDDDPELTPEQCQLENRGRLLRNRPLIIVHRVDKH